jgi:hypothetical protein
MIEVAEILIKNLPESSKKNQWEIFLAKRAKGARRIGKRLIKAERMKGSGLHGEIRQSAIRGRNPACFYPSLCGARDTGAPFGPHLGLGLGHGDPTGNPGQGRNRYRNGAPVSQDHRHLIFRGLSYRHPIVCDLRLHLGSQLFDKLRVVGIGRGIFKTGDAAQYSRNPDCE